jgi:hypothetical protein
MPTTTTIAAVATAAINGTTPPPHSATPAPFCLNCAFNFGHIIDGMDDAAAGALVVSIFVILIAVLCFAAGCYAHVLGVHHKIKKTNKDYEAVDVEAAVVDDAPDKKTKKKKTKNEDD